MMNPRLQELIEKYENGDEYVYVTDDGVFTLVVSRDSTPIYKMIRDFVVSGVLKERVMRKEKPVHINPPEEMLFIELYKHGYNVAKVSELCGEPPEIVEAHFAGETEVSAIKKLVSAAYNFPAEEWEGAMQMTDEQIVDYINAKNRAHTKFT